MSFIFLLYSPGAFVIVSGCTYLLYCSKIISSFSITAYNLSSLQQAEPESVEEGFALTAIIHPP